jgi:hypothetical protein
VPAGVKKAGSGLADQNVATAIAPSMRVRIVKRRIRG